MYARWLGAILLLLAILAPTSGQAQVSSTPDPERAAVQQVITRFGELLQAGDLAAVQSLFAPRGHILTDKATTHGFVEYRDQFLTPDLAVMKAGYAHTAVEATVRGNIAWVAFRRVFGKAGSTGQTEGRGTAVLEKVENRWVFVHLHMSQ
jgi:ketosteroid isomerase-like protein